MKLIPDVVKTLVGYQPQIKFLFRPVGFPSCPLTTKLFSRFRNMTISVIRDPSYARYLRMAIIQTQDSTKGFKRSEAERYALAFHRHVSECSCSLVGMGLAYKVPENNF